MRPMKIDNVHFVQLLIIDTYGFVLLSLIDLYRKLSTISLVIVRTYHSSSVFLHHLILLIFSISSRMYYETYALVCNSVHGPIFSSLLGKRNRSNIHMNNLNCSRLK
jgi:hypothetical protein